MYKIVFCLLIIMFCNHDLIADVRLPAIFGNGMVLQRNEPIAIWGWSDPDEKILVKFNKQMISVIAGTNGKWRINLSKEIAGGPYDLVVEGKNRLVFSDVLVGEVWVCSGQSNMGWPVKDSNNPEQEIANSDFPMIRHIKIPRTIAADPLDDLVGQPKWQAAKPANTGDFTAVGYFYARELFYKLKVPIGLINTSWGGTMSETWTSMEAFESSEEFSSMAKELKSIPKDSLAGTKKPNDYPTLLFNGMVRPIIPYTMRGVIWYQGESNGPRAYQYKQAFPLLINDWRKHWGIGDFPFYFVQLSSWKAAGGNSKTGSTWAELREAQTQTLSLPNTGQAITIDIGNTEDIHPKNKQDVGKRLAAIALRKTYNKKVPYSGPVYRSLQIEKDKIIVSFFFTDGGLKIKEGDTELKGFEIAGANGDFKPVFAWIEGKKVMLKTEGIDSPKVVRYAWADDAGSSNLFNEKGFPAGTFRTDDWPLSTKDQKFQIKKHK